MIARLESLRAQIEELVVTGTSDLRRARSRRARPLAIAGALGMIALLSLVAAIALTAGWLTGAPAAAWPVASGILLVSVAMAGLVWWRARLMPVRRRDALALLDRAGKLEDRLLTADEFLRQPPKGDPTFIAAALEDATNYIGRARTAPVPEVSDRVERLPLRVTMAALCLALLLLVDTLPRPDADDPLRDDETLVADLDGGEVAGREQDDPNSSEPPTVDEPEPNESERPPKEPVAPSAAANVEPGELSDKVKESMGTTGTGKSADASASSKASQAKGAPSGQSQTSQGKAKETQKDERKEPKAQKPPEPGKRKPQEETSGSTAGQGSSKGSSKNPAATDWSSKDQVSTPDDAEIEDDEETEDEEEEQESRGGVQPSLRDRRPPVSRDLRIGFGNRPNPDANGRGGPSAPKKSRGVASLVLGVPIPDRVKGQPNPGKTKITQERIEPREEEPVATEAASRGTRNDPLGRLGRMDMTPWMRQMVRDYFKARRVEDIQ